ncbi:hypothetical protein [uncultured Methanospirillum sp.]|uniref:hypothetical protein n=1 Tax=uncultured Methanospirillum sp. TaxID=262503 RepID=UPI0029C81128|nr:hypothetical protein [uncultured Methanospirillum sp.]
MGGFVVTSERSSRPLEKVGRFRIEVVFVVTIWMGLDHFRLGRLRWFLLFLGLVMRLSGIEQEEKLE